MRLGYKLWLILGIPIDVLFLWISISAFNIGDYGIGFAALGPVFPLTFILLTVSYRAGKESVQ